MNARILIAAALLTIGATATAEPPKAPAREVNPPSSRPAEVVMASADQAQAPAPSPDQAAAPAPVKRTRVARVTTCRCGDQQASDQQ